MCLVYWSTVVNLCKTFSRTVYECYSNSNLNNIYLLSSFNVCWWVTHVTQCDVSTLLHLHCFTHFYGKQTDSCTVQLWTLSNEGSSLVHVLYWLWRQFDHQHHNKRCFHKQNRTNFISNVYIVHSFQHWHIQHITHVIKAEKKKEKKVEKK